MSIKTIQLEKVQTEKGHTLANVALTYETFGPELGQAPVVLVVHALTGNSKVCGAKGWWQDVIGPNKAIDTNHYTVFAPNIPGNGYTGSAYLIENYREYSARDIAQIIHLGLQKLGISKVYAAIGGSIGGGIVWELAAAKPHFIEHLIPVASDWKASDWLLANTFIQDRILSHSSHPLEDARMHAMTFYRTAQSFRNKFNRTLNTEVGIFNVQTWLAHHGTKLRERFTLSAYKTLNHLLASIDISRGRGDFATAVREISSTIHIVAVDTDLFFVPEESRRTYTCLIKLGKKVHYHQIQSIHGHDAFLIEYDQLSRILAGIFVKNEVLLSEM
ncbi:MAG: alpha/beta fold hydrolase [Bacteroidetes bacterium]|nr:alpha/beta fold hydrolase [Bacteroidota bacterium]